MPSYISDVIMLRQVYSNVTMLNNNDTFIHRRDASILVQLFAAYRERETEKGHHVFSQLISCGQNNLLKINNWLFKLKLCHQFSHSHSLSVCLYINHRLGQCHQHLNECKTKKTKMKLNFLPFLFNPHLINNNWEYSWVRQMCLKCPHDERQKFNIIDMSNILIFWFIWTKNTLARPR